ncbi:helix-turn-helix domain-containing protein [Paenibacillus senegalensis]|uniref:helix-turn-helix domain-containing protein n=1 Tax=Paenibacillus senegalensis TaxID=1465766 RepID=UPI00031054FA|nr:helix-turn-helix transcriptional regulator [Paenibacillus senegalensis]
MNYGSRIAQLRKARGLTQMQLSEALDISRASLALYEQNRREPDSSMLTKLSNYFNVSIDYLVGRTDFPQSADENIQQFINHLELSDETILQKYKLQIDGRELTPDEAKRFIAFIRAERSIHNS